MLMKVRTGYGFRVGNKEWGPGEVIDLSDEEIKKWRWKLEPAEPKKKEEPKEVKPEPKVEPKVEEKEEESVLENRAILDTKKGVSLLRRGRNKK